MPFYPYPPSHDFPDRAHRQLLEHPANLGELIAQVAPQVAGGLVLARANLLTRELPLPDWRRRENDLFFQIPFQRQQPADPDEILVGVLVEHQSRPDAAMPLRTLVYATAYWDQQWKDWEKEPHADTPLCLSPVLPIVFHAGPGRWKTHRTLADLFAPPEVFRPFLPSWQPVFWNLTEQTPEALLQSAGAWLKVMAAVRADQLEPAAFQEMTAAVAKGLEPVAQFDKIRWHDLMCFLCAWGKFRRPRPEWAELDRVTQASIISVALRQEVRTMNQVVGQSWAEWAEEHYTALGRSQEALRSSRSHLRKLLEKRFGPLPEALRQRIETTEDVARLEAAFDQGFDIRSLEELQL